MRAFFETVETDDAAGHIDGVFRRVNARRLTVFRAKAAAVTFCGVDPGPKNRESGQKSQNRSDRTDRVAIKPPKPPRKKRHENERYGGGNQRDFSLHPDVRLIKGETPRPFGKKRQKIVSAAINRSEKMGRHAAERAVRIEKRPPKQDEKR